MRLKQIKLAGFKSFVDPTTVVLPGNRCAIVGPNGCGKSNIIDAVRWVMGESSAKQLRGENLTDVIFNGSGSRKPTAVASIELVFDNSDGRIGGEYAAYAEIAIRRQVTRDSQSAYFLNGNKCRRRDISDIFLGTGFGPRSYSIIEQGMISQLVEAKPEDLRVYLEEAAGISKYKERRRETENRIKHTNENLERLSDIREELGRQLDHLQRQARAAEKYQELKKESALLTAELYTIRYLGLAEEVAGSQAAIGERQVALEQAVATQRGLDSQIEAARQSFSENSDQFNGVQGHFYRLGADIARIEEAIAFNAERVKQLEEDLATVRQRAEESAQQLEMDERQITELQQEVAQLGPALEVAQTRDDEARQVLAAAETEHQAWQQQWETFSRANAENDRVADVQASRVEHLNQLLQRFRGRLAQLEDDARSVPAVQRDQVHSLASEIEVMESRYRDTEQAIDRALKQLAEAREAVLDKERVLDQARSDVQTLRHELASLRAVQEAALGRQDREAGSWVEAQGLASAERLGEALAVVPGWERAVESVLGDYLQGIKVANIDDYADALAQVDGGEIALVEARMAAEAEGDLPTLTSLVRSDNLNLGSLLYGVFAAESEAVAMSNRRSLRPGESIVTRTGFWVGPDWVRSPRQEAQSAGIIERAKELEVLGARVDEAETRVAALQGQLTAARAAVETQETIREELQRDAKAAGDALGELRATHGVRQVQLEEAQAQQQRVARERAEIEQQIAEESERLELARQTLAEAEARREALATEQANLTEVRERVQSQLANTRQAASAAREAFHAQNASWQSLRSKLSASESARDRLTQQRRQLAEQEAALRENAEASARPLPELRAELETLLEQRVTVEASLTEVRKAMDADNERIRELESERTEAENEVNVRRERLEQARVNHQGLVVQEANLKQQIAQTGHALEDLQARVPEQADAAEWEAQLEKIDRRIQRLGAINLAAIDEYNTQSERKIYLDQQHEDLVQALETLQTAIRKIDRETRSRFKDTFEIVNARLGELFPKVFGGGHAYLELTGEDLLDTGVSLMARPPGKRNASIHLLSGGEKAMTAVALIFAIFHLNPSPVCLLDEVDAPLDDANVTRFAELIREMSADVQFVVITHNKLTMEMADQLMGVTMNEPGVSRLVSVDVEEAVAMAAV